MSLRTYIFTLLTTLVLIIAVTFSIQSGRFFVSAIDMSIERMMAEIGHQYPCAGKSEERVLSFHVTTDWQKVPAAVRAHFSTIPVEHNVHHSKFVDWILISPPKEVYSLMVVERGEQLVFVSRYSDDLQKLLKEQNPDELINPIVLVILIGLSGIVLFVVTLLFVFRKIAVPVESLQAWAKKLTIDDLGKPRPDFRFKELNSLAVLIHHHLVSVAESVKREQQFLSYASHELRTPIAVLRSNCALLEKINPNPSDKERIVRDRMQRASLSMKSMTETLLWLSREGELDMPIEQVNLGELISRLYTELSYLLTAKPIEVKLDLDDSLVNIAVTPSIIVLNNLIRNAFQHTQQGVVTIEQRHNKVIITNIEAAAAEIAEIESSELGFGLGMQLVEKLTVQFGWPFKASKIVRGYQATVQFSD
ncbi:MAG: HAMP domain-containing histidine kinase [Colwellia sp.]|nr:HAMP domain-containing histidine kinase [Colwellia sp.]